MANSMYCYIPRSESQNAEGRICHRSHPSRYKRLDRKLQTVFCATFNPYLKWSVLLISHKREQEFELNVLGQSHTLSKSWIRLNFHWSPGEFWTRALVLPQLSSTVIDSRAVLKCLNLLKFSLQSMWIRNLLSFVSILKHSYWLSYTLKKFELSRSRLVRAA